MANKISIERQYQMLSDGSIEYQTRIIHKDEPITEEFKRKLYDMGIDLYKKIENKEVNK